MESLMSKEVEALVKYKNFVGLSARELEHNFHARPHSVQEQKVAFHEFVFEAIGQLYHFFSMDQATILTQKQFAKLKESECFSQGQDYLQILGQYHEVLVQAITKLDLTLKEDNYSEIERGRLALRAWGKALYELLILLGSSDQEKIARKVFLETYGRELPEDAVLREDENKLLQPQEQGPHVKEPIKMQNFLFGSKLVSKPEEVKLLKEQLPTTQLSSWVNRGNIGSFCIFRATDHTFRASAFHERCFDQGPLLILVHSASNELFGGFCSVKWPSLEAGQEWVYSEDPGAFLFSLSKKAKFGQYKEQEYTIGSYRNNLVVMGGGADLCIKDNCNVEKRSYANFGATFQPPYGVHFQSAKAQSFFAKEKKFKVLELEVFLLMPL